MWKERQESPEQRAGITTDKEKPRRKWAKSPKKRGRGLKAQKARQGNAGGSVGGDYSAPRCGIS